MVENVAAVSLVEKPANEELAEARQLIEAWRRDYNESRPHMALGHLSPQEYALRSAGWHGTIHSMAVGS
nr:integrase core domain-containing protein [Caulobacter sp. S45]